MIDKNILMIKMQCRNLCFLDINDCAGVTCQNGGACEDKVNAFQCNCAADYSGVHCEMGK